MDFAYLGTILLLVFGFGFVIFWHELGHFLAAKWADVKVEQFAVGFGHAIVSWRKGLGLRWGSSAREYERALAARHERGDVWEPAPGETEYRLNWIPLGGYVKMLGQDDLRPNAGAEDPRAYNNKPVGQRMVIVSAGVIMNVILAVILFAVLFRMGFNVPPAVVGVVAPFSPAQEAGIEVGDRILTIDDNVQHDFNKIFLSIALVEEGQPVKMTVRKPDGSEKELTILPRRSERDRSGGFLQLGITSEPSLQGLDPRKLTKEAIDELKADEPVRPGEAIVGIEGTAVAPEQYHLLDRAVQQARPVHITVEDAQGRRHQRIVQPGFVEPFGKTPLNFAGMMPRAVVQGVTDGSSAKDKLKPGDIILRVTVQPVNDPVISPTPQKLIEVLSSAGAHGQTVDVLVLRDGRELLFTGLEPTVRLEKGRRGLGIFMDAEEQNAVVAATLPDSPAAQCGIPAGARITAIDAQPVAGWLDVQRLLAGATPNRPIVVAATTDDGRAKLFNLTLNDEQIRAVQCNRLAPRAKLKERIEPRKTRNPLVATAWGASETRDLIVQFYLTLKRMIQGSVSPSNAMGPIGIFQAGSRFAYRGHDWLIWFLAMISANLAVVNFLPIPIVDGGLFMFLILEKLTGKPLSPRAQGIAQIVGLALIIGVFLFVTYHDISRLIL